MSRLDPILQLAFISTYLRVKLDRYLTSRQHLESLQVFIVLVMNEFLGHLAGESKAAHENLTDKLPTRSVEDDDRTLHKIAIESHEQVSNASDRVDFSSNM